MNRVILIVLAGAVLLASSEVKAQNPRPSTGPAVTNTKPAPEVNVFVGGEGPGDIRVELNPQPPRDPRDGRDIGVVRPGQPMPGQPMPPGRAPGAKFGPFNVHMGPPKMEKLAYLGIVTSPVGEALQSQLSLPKGVGQVVEFIDPESPAAKALVEKNDVLVKLDDQWVINQQQLEVLIRMHKDGDQVKLTVLRKAKEQVIPVKLVEKEMPVVEMTASGWMQMTGVAPGIDPREFEHVIMDSGGSAMIGTGGVEGTVTYSDGEYTFMPSTKDGKDYILIKERSGKVVFDGPIATEEQKKKVPDGLLKRFQDFRSKFDVRFSRGGMTLSSEAAATKPAVHSESRNSESK